MIDTSFSEITSSQPIVAGNVENWDFVSSSASVAVFDAGVTQATELYAHSGVDWVAHVTEPTKIHQAVEIKTTFATAPGTTAYTGCFARLTDHLNYVLLRVNHNTRQAELVEVIAGAATVLATAPLTAAGDIIGASCRLEILGKRARYWFEPHYRPVEDLPPDGAVDLAGTYTQVGEWGIYLNSSVASPGMTVSHFYAREMPSTALAPPHIYVASASGFNLAPVTATVTSVNAAAGSLEWEIYPVDPDDIPEAYRDTAVATITSRVFWLRPGYTYDLRVRELKKNGGNNAWTAFQRIVVPGSKVSPTQPTMPDIDFPNIIPDYALDQEQHAESVNSDASDTGREQFAATYIRPQNSFKLVFENKTAADAQTLVEFFDTVQSQRKAFKWVHFISGQQFAMHFSRDDYEITYRDQQPDSTKGAICDLAFDIMEVVTDAVGTLTFSIEADLSLVTPAT